jgi:hypothetical protein
MTEQDLATLLREHVQECEPPFSLSADAAIGLGRRTLIRRRARRGLAGLVVAGAAAVTLPMVLSGAPVPAGDDGRIDPMTTSALQSYDAGAMRAIIDEHVRMTLGHDLDGLGQAEFEARDDQGTALPQRYYDKASSMEVAYEGTGGRRVRVALMHSRSEAEGDARKNCAADLADGYAFSCTVSVSADGDPVTTTVTALRPLDGEPGWGALTREELRTGVPAPGDPNQKRIDPADVYFQRSVESVHSETFLTNASELVRAPDLATAQRLWKVPVADFESVVTDPELVIPEPPRGENGCPWTLDKNNTCGKDPLAN